MNSPLATRHAPTWVILLLVLLTLPAVADINRWVDRAEKTDDLKKRVEYLSHALDEDRSIWWLWSMRADAHRMLENYRKAEADANEGTRRAPKEWEAWRCQALVHFFAEDYEGTIADASEAIKLKADEPLLFSLRSEAYRLRERLDESIRDATTALSLDSKNIEARLNRAEALRLKQEYKKSAQDFDRAFSLDNRNVTTVRWRINLWIDMKRYDDALKDCDRLATLVPDSDEATKERARVLAIQGIVEQDPDKIHQSVELDAENPDRWLQLGIARLNKDQWAEAITALDRAISLRPDFAEAFHHRAEAGCFLGHYARAIDDATKCLKLEPNNALARAIRGNAYASLEEYTKAVHDLSVAIDLDPTCYFAVERRSFCYGRMQKYDSCLADARRIVELAKNDVDKSFAYIRLSEAFRMRGDVRKAENAVQEAIRLDPDSADAYFEYGVIFRIKNQLELAITEFRKGLEHAPDSPYGLTWRGVTYSEMGRASEAEQDLQKSIKVDKYGTEKAYTYTFLADAARQQGNYQAAIEHATLALDMRPRNAHAQAFVIRGASHHELKDYEQAVRDCSEAIQRDREYAFAYAMRGAAYRELGRFELTINDCTQAIGLSPFFQFPYFERAQAELAKYRGAGSEIDAPGTELPPILMDPRSVHLDNAHIAGAGAKPKPEDEDIEVAGTDARPYEPEPVLREELSEDMSHPLQRAATDFEMLVSMDFELVASATGLAQCLHEMERFDKAVETCQSALVMLEQRDLDKDPSIVPLLVARSWSEYARGHAERGRDSAQQAVALNAEHAEARLALACGQGLFGQWEACQTECQAGLKLRPAAVLASRLVLLWYAAQVSQKPSDRTGYVMHELVRRLGIPTTQWPGPLVNVLAENEELEQFAARLPQEEEERISRARLLQALYYFGIRDLSLRRLVPAREKFRRALRVGMRQNVEYALANAVLTQLGG